MTLFSRKQLVRHAVAAGAVLAAGAVTASPLRAADDLPVVDIQIDDIEMPSPPLDYRDQPPRHGERPYERPYPERPYRPGPYGAGSYAAIPSARLERPLDARPMLPPMQVMTILRSTGYSPLGRITQRGWIYTVAALDPRGDDGRLIIDARTGRIMRFIPALDADAQLNDRFTTVYGPPGPPLIADARRYVPHDTRRGSLLDLQHSPRPPVAVPKTAQRPAPRAASRTAQPAPESAQQKASAPAQQAAVPSTESSAAAKPPPAVTIVEKKPAAVTVGAVPASAQQPSTLKLWPTQAMPDVQPLD